MKKIFKLSIDIEAKIIDHITPKLIEKRIAEDYDTVFTVPQEAIQKLQDILSYILKHQNYHRDILVGDLLENQSNLGGDTELGKYFQPKIFDDIALAAGKEMGPQYESFLIDLFNYRISACAKRFYSDSKKPPYKEKAMGDVIDFIMTNYDQSLIPINGTLPELKVEEEITEYEMICECLMLLLLDCLTTYKISGASLEDKISKKPKSKHL